MRVVFGQVAEFELQAVILAPLALIAPVPIIPIELPDVPHTRRPIRARAPQPHVHLTERLERATLNQVVVNESQLVPLQNIHEL